jgi:hypothetical protein
MNSVQLAQRLARNLAVDDSANPPAEANFDVLSAINAGLAAFYREMPGIYKRTELSHAVRAPRTVNVTYAAKYRHTVGDNTFDSTMMGCSVRFSSAIADTQVTGTNTVLDDYLLDNLGPMEATVYGDVVPIQDVIERVIGHVRCYDTTQSQPTLMIRDERLRSGRPLYWNWPWGQSNEGWFPPRYYYLEPAGQSQGMEPEFFLRVAPWPDTDYTIRMEAELLTQRIIMSDLTVARRILVPDGFIDDIFIPMCEAELITSPFWRDPNQVKNVLLRKDTILATKIPKIPQDVAPPCNLMGTPRGF